MNNQKQKHGSLSRVLGKYFIICFLLFFISAIIGHIIHDVLTNSMFDYKDIFLDLLFALVVAVFTTLFFWDKLKDVFTLLNNDKVELPQSLHSSKVVRPYQSFQIDNLVSKLEKSGMLITYLDRNKGIIKMREKLLFFNKCGGILHFDHKKEELTMISFSFADSKKRLANFNKEMHKLIELQKEYVS
jgi:hypothetical protein